jgi:hypothetical protein
LISRSGISITVSGSTKKTSSFLDKVLRGDPYSGLEVLAQQGVNALQAATPVASGLTANSWTYEIEKKGNAVTINWVNTHTVSGVNIAVILQYGHGTGSGGYVSGRDYINPAIKPIMDKIADEVWRKVTSG